MLETNTGRHSILESQHTNLSDVHLATIAEHVEYDTEAWEALSWWDKAPPIQQINKMCIVATIKQQINNKLM